MANEKSKKIFEEPFYESVISKTLQSPAKDLSKIAENPKPVYEELKAKMGGWLAAGQVGAIVEFTDALPLIAKGELTPLEIANATNNLITITGNTSGASGMYDVLEDRVTSGKMTYSAGNSLAGKTSNDYVSSIIQAHEAYKNRARRVA